MLRFAATVAVVLALGGTTTVAADSGRPVRSRVAVVAGNKDAVFGAGKRLWRGEPGERVISAAVWSKTRDAVAFATRARNGAVTLVVVLVGGDSHGHTMRWPIPPRAESRGSASVTWLGRRRVAFGRSTLRPTVVASWRVR